MLGVSVCLPAGEGNAMTEEGEYEIFNGAKFSLMSVREFQIINRLANESGLMAKIIWIEDSPIDRTIDFILVPMHDKN